MIQQIFLLRRHSHWLWSALSLLVLLCLALAACGGSDATSTASTASGASNASSSSASSLVPRNGSGNNTYQLVFSMPGTYQYSSTLVHRQNNEPEGASSSAMGTITVTG
jgi:hypothetical protein